MRLSFSILGALILTAPCVYAQENYNVSNSSFTVVGRYCEEFVEGMSKSAARMEAADKAAFVALRDLDELKKYQNNMDKSQFENKILRLVDNLDNLSITTLKQTSEELCVEVNALLSEATIKETFANIVLASTTEENKPDDFEVELPPKPNITINEDIAYVEKPTVEKKLKINGRAKQIFVDRTEFFDGTSTGKFFDYLKKDLLKIPGVEVTDRQDNPDYVLKTKVLKAKIDKLNAATNRLQVVVALTLTDTKTGESVTEHQNRFILFAAEDDAQKTASALVVKLFSGGMGKISSHIEVPMQDNGNGLIAAPF